MRRTLAALIAVAALVAGCGENEPIRETTETTTEAGSGLDDVQVAGAPGEQPTLTFEQPFGVEATTTRVLTEGDGEAIAAGSTISFDFLFVNGRDGNVLGTSYDTEPTRLVFEDSLMPGIFKGLDGVTAGSRVLVGIAPADGAGADPTSGVLETDTLLFFAEVLDDTSG